MNVTVLWEDQRGSEANGFGPDVLLGASVGDRMNVHPDHLKAQIRSHAKKGNGRVRAALVRDLERLRADGSVVVAVIDRDRVRDLWTPPPPVCRSGIVARWRQDVEGDHELVLLEDNMETLVEAACRAGSHAVPKHKPRPDERDRILGRAAWAAQDVRDRICADCTSFSRLVTKVHLLLTG